MIQVSFGWFDSHLHSFDIDSERYGIPYEDDWTPIRDERRISINQVAGAEKIPYTYDFGDWWEHDVVFEKTLLAEEVGAVPDCIDGRWACPPEDSVGYGGHADLLEILSDTSHPEHAE
ncbi:plasmid pRiA4b ORF-3 family protein [Candidatus Poriferisocius sp.]|uniref:plasmid pRiA4b ORF-3 family protein n=1 Tax=Candidatus Poriferisocius sp. TaxID=3101276 RepID=UPI003B590506